METIERINLDEAMRLPAEVIVTKYHAVDVDTHPFFAALARGPVDLRAVYFLMANLQEGISRHFVSWLARTIERVEDRRISSLLAKQLNDELGNGDFAQIHSRLLERFVAALSSWQPDIGADRVLSAGRRLAQDGGRPFLAADPYEGVGALIVGEIFAEKMDTCLADQMRRQTLVSGDALTWLDVHEKLEVNHSEDSAGLAMLVPRDGNHLAATWRGAIDQWTTLWHFLDDVHALSVAHGRLGTT
jgi:pyrroloquinoline quinone (PQQ) biosynthesis protein C